MPPGLGKLRGVGDPFYFPHMATSNRGLVECPECHTCYDWKFEYDYLATGSEDDLEVTRLRPEEAEKRRQAVAQAIKDYHAWFAANIPANLQTLRQSRDYNKVSLAVRFFLTEGMERGCDIECALPELVGILPHIHPESISTVNIRTILRKFAAKSPELKQRILTLLNDHGLGPEHPFHQSLLS
ncbi:MAG: hypothetical protein K1Y36_14065 [Blastocatellia bacterium]|nr:hypothetical protein [Blastocatellia bacterium]